MRTGKIRYVALAAFTALALVAVAGPTSAGAHGRDRDRDHRERDRDHRERDHRDRDRHDRDHRDRDHRGRGHHGHHGHHGHGGHGHGDPIRILAEGLNAPFGLDVEGRYAYVAESDAGQITKVDLRNGRTRPAVTGLTGPSSVAKVDDRLVIVTGEAGGPPPEEGGDAPPAAAVEAPPSTEGTSSVFVARPGRAPRLLADLLAYELENNPDGQAQFGPGGVPLDALSNPFDVIEHRNGGVLVADAGANAVLRVSRRGHVSTFFVPPVVTTGVCAGAQNNDPEHAGCDPVPTGLAYGPRGTLYVSTLSAEAPGEGRIYVLDARSGRVRDVISGFNGPTGVAVGDNGTIYVSEVLHNAPEGEGPPPPGFDPATVGRIVKVTRNGHRTYAAVTMPTGLDFEDGRLYASAWSIAGFLGIPDAGQVVQVSDRAFRRAAPSPTTTTTMPPPVTTTTVPGGSTTTTTVPGGSTTTTTAPGGSTTTTTAPGGPTTTTTAPGGPTTTTTMVAPPT